MSKQQLSLNSIIHKSNIQVSVDVNGEAIILNLKDGLYYGLNTVAARIWELIQEPITIQSIHDTLLEEYEVTPDVCFKEILALLEELEDKGLIQD
jgi:hypothetical protein